jgi:ferritin
MTINCPPALIISFQKESEMLKSSVEKALNDQLNAEMYSSYLYMAMAAYFESINLNGFAHWMTIQAGEEMDHARRFYSFIFERDGRVKLGAIDKPPLEWKSTLDAFKAAYNHEVKVSGLIHKIVDLTRKENDHATENFLGWFIAEQVEEESSTLEIVNQLKMIKDSVNGLFMLNAHLGRRGSD